MFLLEAVIDMIFTRLPISDSMILNAKDGAGGGQVLECLGCREQEGKGASERERGKGKINGRLGHCQGFMSASPIIRSTSRLYFSIRTGMTLGTGTECSDQEEEARKTG